MNVASLNIDNTDYILMGNISMILERNVVLTHELAMYVSRIDVKQSVYPIMSIFNEQRTKDLKKLSFHTGIPVEVLEGYLRSKD